MVARTSPLDAALTARETWLAKRDERSRRSYEHALRRCTADAARDLVVRVGWQSMQPAERAMPRIGEAMRAVVVL